MSSFHRRPGFLLALGLCVIGGAVTLLGRLAVGPQTAPTRVPLTNVAGTEACPSFSPNGRHLAYSGRGGEGDTYHVWVRALPSGAPQQLTHAAGNDICPVWSPDGSTLAFLRVTDDGEAYFAIPAAGGAERKFADTDALEDSATIRGSVSWMRDGKSLAVVRSENNKPPAIFIVPLDGGAPRRVTDPPAGAPGDSNPSVSPDGQTIAFVRSAAGETGDVWLCDTKGGTLRQLTFDSRPTRGVAWTPDGHDLIYASTRFNNRWQLWRIPAFGGSSREVAIGARAANDPAIAPDGHRLAYTQTPSTSAIWLANLPAGENLHTRPIIRSEGREAFPSYSPDGRRIAWVSDRSGADEIWVSDANGENETQVTNTKAMSLDRPRWSADGQKLLFVSRGMPQSVYTVQASARMAQPKPLALAPGAVVNDVSWSHDGSSIYGQWRGNIWRFGRGGENRQLTQQFGAMRPEESPDGKWVYYAFRRGIWRVPANGGAEEEVSSPDLFVSTLQTAPNGIYFMGWESRRRVSIDFFDLATKKTSEVLRLNDAEISRNAAFDVSPDGKYLLYPKIDRAQTDLVLVENFR
jgi:Tol biopolymer transport system component